APRFDRRACESNNGLDLIMATVESLEVDGAGLRIDWADGHRSVFHALWLRDNCPCPECRHPSGQRLLDTRSIPDAIAVAAAHAGNGRVETTFADGHRARWEAGWLRDHCSCDEEPLSGARHRLWD